MYALSLSHTHTSHDVLTYNHILHMQVPSVCPTRYIGLVKVIAQLNTASAHVESLLLLARSEKKE